MHCGREPAAGDAQQTWPITTEQGVDILTPGILAESLYLVAGTHSPELVHCEREPAAGDAQQIGLSQRSRRWTTLPPGILAELQSGKRVHMADRASTHRDASALTPN